MAFTLRKMLLLESAWRRFAGFHFALLGDRCFFAVRVPFCRTRHVYIVFFVGCVMFVSPFLWDASCFYHLFCMTRHVSIIFFVMVPFCRMRHPCVIFAVLVHFCRMRHRCVSFFAGFLLWDASYWSRMVMVMEGRAPLGEEHDTGTLDDDGDGDGRACTLAITAPKEDCKP